MKIKTIAFFMMIGLASQVSLASLVLEMELDATATNHDPSSAEVIGAGSFTINVNPKVFGSLPTATVSGRNGSSDVDFFAFQAGPGTAYFDIDNESFTFDSYLALFDSSGTLLADNDDSFPQDPGSASDRDAFLGEILLPGFDTYYIAVAAYPNFPNATFTGDDFFELTRPDGAYGGFAFSNATPGDSTFDLNGVQIGSPYLLHVTIPEPGMMALLLIGLAVISTKSKRS